MIGNDIIDLALAHKESRWQRRGFLTKLFTTKEQWLISKASDSEIMVWSLWSRKEAVYKIYNRQTQIRAYIPLHLECLDGQNSLGIYYGKVQCFDQIYYTKTLITADFIDTVAVQNPDDFERIETLAPSVIIQKKNGIPSYLTENTVFKPLSKSHHGRFERLVTLSDLPPIWLRNQEQLVRKSVLF